MRPKGLICFGGAFLSSGSECSDFRPQCFGFGRSGIGALSCERFITCDFTVDRAASGRTENENHERARHAPTVVDAVNDCELRRTVAAEGLPPQAGPVKDAF